IEKDRIRRYESVDALAADVQRHLDHEPVLAGSPGMIYHLRKFSRKHRSALAVAFGILVIVSLGLLFTVMYARVVNQRRKDQEAIIAKERVVAHRECLWEAQKLYDEGRYAEGLSQVGPILASETMGERARLLYGRLLRPEPADGSDVGVRPQVRLGWAAGSDVSSHNVYFGTAPDDLMLLCQVQGNCHATSPRLQSRQWYCWRVDAVLSNGSVIEGQPYSFSTGNMIAWWKLELTETGDMLDSSGNALHGKLMGDAHIISDPLRGDVLSLDGKSDCGHFGTNDRFKTIGSIDYLTPGVNPSNAGDESMCHEVAPHVSNLTDGTNVLAVEIHRAEASGSDIGCDLFFVGPTEKKALVPWGSTWKYLDDGSDQGTAWYEPGFDDSGWASGPAELGHGSGNPATIVGWREAERNITHYFRHSFNVADASKYQGLHLGIKRDDGAVVYLNGNEIYRDDMPAGKVTYATPALISKYSGASTWFGSCFVDANNLVDGTNVLAVEIHQRLGGSGDIAFDLLLAESTDLDTLVGPNATWKYLDDGSYQGTAWYGDDFDDSDWASGSAKPRYDDANNKNITRYLRHSFNVPDASIYRALRLGITSDDGAVVYLNGTKIAKVNMPYGLLTVAAWTKVPELGGKSHTIISKGPAWFLVVDGREGPTGVFGFRYYGAMVTRLRWPNDVRGNVPVNAGKWHHVAAVSDGVRIHLYVDGKLDISQKAFGTIVSNDHAVVVGDHWERANYELNGSIDDVRIYNYALSAADIETLYSGRGPGPLEKPKWAVNVGL
ncbi:MAG: LamG domain-containing protein, partial [Planctomycetota bacterium]